MFLRAAVLAIGGASLPAFGQVTPLPEVDHSSVGFPTVDVALTTLRVKPGAEVSVQGGWTIISDREESTLWSFIPAGHPAYPAVVKRQTHEKDGGAYISMSVLCQSTKAPCDQLVRDFNALNDRVRESLQHKAQQAVQSDRP